MNAFYADGWEPIYGREVSMKYRNTYVWENDNWENMYDVCIQREFAVNDVLLR